MKDQDAVAQSPRFKVELGCGPTKNAGFVGIDRFALSGVDIVCDLGRGVPLANDCVDALLSVHSLEHFPDLPAIMGEIYRVCRDRAVVTIVAPYAETRLNQANPYHVQTINEHTPRFFTADPESPFGMGAYTFPLTTMWGLSGSDHSEHAMDFRLIGEEYHYMPPYRRFPEEVKRVLRQSLSDVCDNVVFHLLVVKSPIGREEIETYRNGPMPEVAGVAYRRSFESDANAGNILTEIVEAPSQVAALHKRVVMLEAQLAEMAAVMEALALRTMERLEQGECGNSE